MSLQVYGQVSEAIIWWNDGSESNVYVQENNNIKNKLGFRGSAKITSDWSAGYGLELQIRAYRSSSANQLSLGATNNVQIAAYNTQSVSLRYANWYIESKTYGRVTVGRSPDAPQGIAGINLARPDGFAGFLGPGYAMQGYFLRRSGTTGNGGLSALTWGTGAFIRNGSSMASFDYSQTASHVKYTSPFFLGQSKSTGFRFDAAWGADDQWSLGLRYAETWGQFRVAAGLGYSDWRGADRGQCSLGSVNIALPQAGSNVDCNAWVAGGSIMHTPTGLYVSGGGGQMSDNNSQAAFDLASATVSRPGNDGNSSAWYVQAGWQAKLNTLGSTTFWGQYLDQNVGFGVRNSVVQTVAAADPLNSLGGVALIGGSNVQIWSIGVSQNIDAAAMTLYMGFQNASTEVELISRSAAATNVRGKSNPIDDMQLFYTGATIRF